ncbi:tetratricopeptide repeat protein [Afifella pfennigii]|uniref:tetratricopeptide repeat protein n=1 Tax=Afifella pfennigii TaxID=209897 RepID=UPI00047A6C36|nr:tetratricopeptide repeat protein [Afifella pfennigii]
MTHDDRTSDHFIREVDEELRREQLKGLWDRFGIYIILACVLVVAVTAGYRGYIWWQGKQAAETGDRYLSALALIESGRASDGRAMLDELVAEGSGYGMLARLRQAELAAAGEDRGAALAAFDAIADDASVPQVMRDLAQVRAALIALDTGDLDGAGQRAEPLSEAGNAWRYSAREILGVVAYSRGDLAAAREHFISIQTDAQAPRSLSQRAGLMLAVIDGQLGPSAGAEAGAEGAASDDPDTEMTQ